MKTLSLFVQNPPAIPAAVAWYLTSIAESKGRQDLYKSQSPQKLKVLREHALIQSAVSSNRIEGVTIDASRVGTVVFGKPLLRDRNEEEVGGYREALKLIHEKGRELKVAESTILRLHKLARGGMGDAGSYKERDGDIIERYPDGRSKIRFRTVGAKETPACMRQLVDLWGELEKDGRVPFMVRLAAFNLDFLCVHPFRDGNGRVSRLLMLLQMYHGGFDVGRYIGMERLIEEHKERYYETLELSSKYWHEGRHDPWPYIQFVLYIFKSAYKEFEDRLSQLQGARGEKKTMIIDAMRVYEGSFSVGDLRNRCPGISIDMIRHVLKDLKKSHKVECLGRGQAARWRWVPGN